MAIFNSSKKQSSLPLFLAFGPHELLCILYIHAPCHKESLLLGSLGFQTYLHQKDIRIAMFVLPYIGTKRKLKFQFSFQNPLNLIFINIKVENMLKANYIWKMFRKACKTGVILVATTYTVVVTVVPYSSSSSSGHRAVSQ